MHTNKYQLYQRHANNNLGHNKHPQILNTCHNTQHNKAQILKHSHNKHNFIKIHNDPRYNIHPYS
jgi:hypothetical protein